MIHETERSNNLAQLNETALESILGSIPVGQEVGEGYSLLPTDGLYGKAPLERGRVELLVLGITNDILQPGFLKCMEKSLDLTNARYTTNQLSPLALR